MSKFGLNFTESELINTFRHCATKCIILETFSQLCTNVGIRVIKGIR